MAAFAVLIAPIAFAFAFVTMGLLSRKLGIATRAKPYYLGFFAAAGLMLISGGARFLYALLPIDAGSVADILRLLLLDGLPALAATLAVILAWRYWSWLLAERA
jgi:hypothetical protein